MSANRETRFLTATELRASGGTGKNDAPPSICGYASVFGKPSQNLGGFKEKIKPGTFARALREKQDVRCLWNHSESVILGRTKSGTLALREDAHGLFFDCVLPDTQAARDLHTSVSRGDISENSFAFSCAPGGEAWSEEMDEETDSLIPMRTLSDVDLFDVSPVCRAAYTSTELQARSANGKSEKRFMENTMQTSFSEEQRAFLSGDCGVGYTPIPQSCPTEMKNRIVEIRGARLHISPAGKATPANDNELAAKLRALNQLS